MLRIGKKSLVTLRQMNLQLRKNTAQQDCLGSNTMEMIEGLFLVAKDWERSNP